MNKNYQTTNALGATVEGFVMPDAVSVAMAELAGAVNEGLLAFAIGAGRQVMQVLMDDSVTALAGRRAATTRPAPPSGTGAKPAR